MAIDSTKPTVAISQGGSDNDVDVISSALPTGASTEITLALIKAKTDNLDVALSTRTKPADQQHTIVDSSALPTGAATAAKQPALGVAGTPSADVISIQGIASMTAVKVDGSAVTQPISAAALPLPSGASTEATLATRLSESDFDTKTGSLTESAPATDVASSGLNGRLQRIAQRISSLIALLPAALGAGGGLKVDGSGTALPVSGTVTANAGTNLNTSALALETGGNLATVAGAIKAEDAAHSSGDVGVMALAVRAASPTDRSAGPTDGDYEPLGVNEAGALWVSVTPSANGGASTMNASSSDGATALTNAAQAIKASAGSLKGYYIYNPNASAAFVQFYNTASGGVTVGTTNPLFMLTIPASSAANLWMPDGIKFDTAMSWSAVSTAGGNGALGTALDATAWFK